MSAQPIEAEAAAALSEADVEILGPARSASGPWWTDPYEILKRVFLSTEPAAKAEVVAEEAEWPLSLAHGWIGLKKSLRGLGLDAGKGLGGMPAIGNYLLAAYHRVKEGQEQPRQTASRDSRGETEREPEPEEQLDEGFVRAR